MANQFVTPTTVAAAIQASIDSQQTGGQHWPPAAEYAVKSNRYHPVMGWAKNSTMEFFLERQDLTDWINDAMTDIVNGLAVAFQAYEWDWGPQPMPLFHHLVEQLPPTEAERKA